MAKAQKHLILGVHVTNRVKHAGEIQNVLTRYGCSIKVRLGLHEASKNVCAPSGIILLEMVADDADSRKCAKELAAIQGVEVQKMLFGH